MQGSSVDPELVGQVHDYARGKRCLVVLDSNRTHEHVLAELNAYAGLVSVGSYCVVMDTLVEDMPQRFFEDSDRPWGVGDNPKTAVREYLKAHPEFKVDEAIQHKILLTVAPDGYLQTRGLILLPRSDIGCAPAPGQCKELQNSGAIPPGARRYSYIGRLAPLR